MTAAVRTRPRPDRPVRDVFLPGDRPRSTPAPAPQPAARVRPRRAPRRSGTGHPSQITECACQWGPTTHCLHGRHDQCHAPAGMPACETHLTYADSTCVLAEGGPVEVWLADRVCRWTCSCSHHTATAAPPVLTLAGGWEQPTLPI